MAERQCFQTIRYNLTTIHPTMSYHWSSSKAFKHVKKHNRESNCTSAQSPCLELLHLHTFGNGKDVLRFKSPSEIHMHAVGCKILHFENHDNNNSLGIYVIGLTRSDCNSTIPSVAEVDITASVSAGWMVLKSSCVNVSVAASTSCPTWYDWLIS